MACYKPLKGYLANRPGSPLYFSGASTGDPNARMVFVPCGQCIGCRLDRSIEWAVRITHEAQMHEENCFLTLTYNDEFLPTQESLVKSDFQKFMKRLRKKLEPKKIKFFMCGEYGEDQDAKKVGKSKLGRPHYHCVVHGYKPRDLVLFTVRNGISLWTSSEVSGLWSCSRSRRPFGFVTVGDVTFESAAYVGRYCVKKITGEKADEHYEKVTRYGELVQVEPEYASMSGGLGRLWLERFRSDVFPNNEVINSKGRRCRVPRYYSKELEKNDPFLYEKIKEKCREYWLRDKVFEENQPARLAQKEAVKTASMNLYKRTLE